MSSIQNQEQLARRVDQVISHGFTGSVKAELDVVDGKYLKELAAKGFEIMGTIAWAETTLTSSNWLMR